MVKVQNATLNRKDTSEKVNNLPDPDVLFNNFIQASTCKQTLSTFHNLCHALDVHYPPSPSSTSSTGSDHVSFYLRLKKKLVSWKAQSLWSKLDSRFFGKDYFVNPKQNRSGGKRAGLGTKVLIIGAGPCGLRTAIEMACLGAKVVVVEKRDSFSRNNSLHLWPFIITDLKAMGAKKLYGKFCSGAIDHVSIRQLQLILLKISLVLGVEIIVNVSFKALRPPSIHKEDNQRNMKGWTAEVEPINHPLANYEFDVIVGADGKRNTLQGFKRKEFRGKLAIGLTVNFINRNTTAEAKVEEISGVAYIFNQEFFKNLQRETGIDLENIVYYKGETHYFVMTAKKHSLVAKGVLKQDYDDTTRLLSYDNLDRKAMESYAREAADFSTHHQLPNLDFAINTAGQPDVALFDFTCMYAAVNAALFRDVNGHKLLSCLVGDSLLEPFWPMGTGCARGFFAAFDAVWMTKQWAMKRIDKNSSDISVELAVLAERESIYRQLHQTTPQNTMKNINDYTIDPNTRYVNLNKKVVRPNQVKAYYLADRETTSTVEQEEPLRQTVAPPNARKSTRSTLTRKVSLVRSNKLLNWCKHITNGYKGININDLSSSWRNGLAICAIIHRFRPDLINWNKLNADQIEKNNQTAFDIAETQLGISPVMTGKDMATCEQVDKLLMFTYLSQFYELFKHETPTGSPPAPEEVKTTKVEERPKVEESPKSPPGISSTSPVGLLTRFTQHIKRRSVQHKDDHSKKKKKHSLFKKKESSSIPEDPVPSVKEPAAAKTTKGNDLRSGEVQIGDATVQMRSKNNDNEARKSGIRQSDRISALSNQLIVQFERNSPLSSPAQAKRKVDLEDVSESSASDMCYFCNRRVYIFGRLSAEGFFFHRECFVCSHCGLTLRRGGYVFMKDTGKFFCGENCVAAMKTRPPHKRKVADLTSTVERDGETPLKSVAERMYRTPEKIELENIRLSMLDLNEELSEEDLARYNFNATSDENDSPADIDDMSDSSDEDIDWEIVLRKAREASLKQRAHDNSDDPTLWLQDDSLIGSDMSVADISTDECSLGNGSEKAKQTAGRSHPGMNGSDASVADVSTDDESASLDQPQSNEESFNQKLPMRSSRKSLTKYDTLDRVEEYLRSAPIKSSGENSNEAFLEERRSSSVSMSSSTSEESNPEICDMPDLHSDVESDLKAAAAGSQVQKLGSVHVTTTDTASPALDARETFPSSFNETSSANFKRNDDKAPDADLNNLNRLTEEGQSRDSFPPTPKDQWEADSDQFYTPTRSTPQSLLKKQIIKTTVSPTTESLDQNLILESSDVFVSASCSPIERSFMESGELPASSSEQRKQTETTKIKTQDHEEKTSGLLERDESSELARTEEQNVVSDQSPVLEVNKSSPQKKTQKEKATSKEKYIKKEEKHNDENKKKSKHFFHLPQRKKHKKVRPASESVTVSEIDGSCTLDRKYSNQSDREKAILRGERFRFPLDASSSGKSTQADSYDSNDEYELRRFRSTRRRTILSKLTPEQIEAKIAKKVQVAARRQAKVEAQKRLRRAQVIQRQLEEVEVKQKEVEGKGVKLEVMLRTDEGDIKEDSRLMQKWFEMVQEKNALLRYENELMIYQRELQLEDTQSRLQQELREKMALDDQKKSKKELAEEAELLQKMLEVVEQRDELVALLEQQRLKERDETMDRETVMLNKFNVITEEPATPQPIETTAA